MDGFSSTFDMNVNSKFSNSKLRCFSKIFSLVMYDLMLAVSNAWNTYDITSNLTRICARKPFVFN